MSQGPEIWHWGDDRSLLERALDAGVILAIPTESSYGLAVDPRSATGVEAIFKFKNRAPDKPLPVVMADRDQVDVLGGDASAPALVEVAALWPAPLTLIVPIERPVPASVGSRSLAVRVPAHDRLRALLRSLDRPMTATSANPSGGEPVSDSVELRALLGDRPSIIVDDGRLPGGPASTIIEATPDGYRILRRGALDQAWLQDRLSRPVFSAAAAEIPADDSAQA